LLPALASPHQVAMSHPMAVTNCNIDMESLIADPNRSIATLVRQRPWAGGGCWHHVAGTCETGAAGLVGGCCELMVLARS